MADPVALDWEDGQPPRSRLYGDVYFSRDDGLAEARAVFLDGCGLPDAWRGRRRFTVAELGFGTGLNILALLDLWRRQKPAVGRLNIFSVEAHLLSRDQAARALEGWPELSDMAGRLLSAWPSSARGFHRLDFEALDVTLDLAVMEAGEALTAWSGAADAWLLDGFSPALNPAMWRGEVLDLVAARSAPGARLATYTVAGAVRRDLAAAGFAVERRPGFGRKRERLLARLGGKATEPQVAPTVAIVGGGIAGAALCRAFADQGMAARVFDAAASSPNASAGPAALVTPRLDAGLGPIAALFAQAFRRAVTLYQAVPGAILSQGALHLAVGDKDEDRFSRIAESDLFDRAAVRPKAAAEASDVIGETAPAGLAFDGALVVAPGRVLDAWLGVPERREVARLEARDERWRLVDGDGSRLAEADVVIVAGGFASAALLPNLPITPVRGQASIAAGARAPALALLFGGYAMAAPGGVMFGATHERGDTSVEARDADHARNLATVRAALPSLGERLEGAPLTAHAGTRAVTRDFLPICGAVVGSAGVYVLTGLGSRGYCLAPLLAEHVAALVLDASSPLPAEAAVLVDPRRFARREARRRQHFPSRRSARHDTAAPPVHEEP